MRGRKLRGKGKKRFRKRGESAGFSSQNRQEEFEEEYEGEEEGADGVPERPVNTVEREGEIAVNLLSRKIQLRRLVNELANQNISDDNDYPAEEDEYRYSSLSPEQEDGRKRPEKVQTEKNQKGKMAEGQSSKRKKPNGRNKPEGKGAKPEVIEDEEVLRIIGELEKEVDTSFAELVDISDEEEGLDALTVERETGQVEESNVQNQDSDEKSQKKRIEIKFDLNEDKNEINSEPDEVGGLVEHGPYSRVLLVGDSGLMGLDKLWHEYAYVRPQILVEARLTLEGIKDFILSKTQLPHLENGTLLMCSVGIYDIITMTDFKDCHTVGAHPPLQIMALKEKSVEDLVKLVLMRLKVAYKTLEELLDSSSVVCFTAVTPCDPIAYFDYHAKYHTPKGHTSLTPVLRDTLTLLRDKIRVVCDRVNKQLMKLCPMPSLWEIMWSYQRDEQLNGRVFYDGLNITEATADILDCRLNKFFQELFFGVEIHHRFIEFNHDQEVIVVGDSRLKVLEKMWCGDKPKFYCEPGLGFFNFPKYIDANLVGLKNKIVIVCLGLNDLIMFKDDDKCLGKNHEPNKIIVPVLEEDEAPEKFMVKVKKNMEMSFSRFTKVNSSFMFFATTYHIDIPTYINYHMNIHKKKTGHEITPQYKNMAEQKKLLGVMNLLNSHMKYICQNQMLPVWDMCDILGRGKRPVQIAMDVLKDGIYPNDRASEKLIRSYHHFVNTKLSQDSFEDPSKYKYKSSPIPKILHETKRQEPSTPSQPLEVPSHPVPQERKFSKPPPLFDPKPHVPKPHGLPAPHRAQIRRSSPPASSSAGRIPVTGARQRSGMGSVHRRLSPGRRILRSPERDHWPRFSRPSEIDQRPRHLQSPERNRSSRFSRSPERVYKSRFSRTPERFSNMRYSRSPERMYRSRMSRSPERMYNARPSRSPERSHRSRSSRHSEERSSDRFSEYRKYQKMSVGEPDSLDVFMHSIKIIRKQCQKEKDPVTRDALLDLCDTHYRECELYLNKPDAHPDYAKEYRLFVEKKRQFITDLGGDPDVYDYVSDWGQFWPTRMFDLFKECWVTKKHKCVTMLSSRMKRSSSSSSSSGAASSPHRKRKHSKKKLSKRLRSVSPEVKKKNNHNASDKWKPLNSSPSEDLDNEDNFPSDFKPPKKINIMIEPRVVAGPSAETSTSYSNEGNSKSKKKSLKVVEVLGILAYMKDKLGVFGMPVSVLYEKAVTLEKNGIDPNQILEDDETATLLSMLNDKLTTIIEEGEGSAIQKAIFLEAQLLLKDLLNEVTRRKKKRFPEMAINIAQIARLTMGKSISETITIIKSFLLYEGHADVSREKLENIYMSVKDEQLKLNNSVSSLPSLEDPAESIDLPSAINATLSRSRPSQSRRNFLPPDEELTEEFFIGQKSFGNPRNKSTYYAPSASSSIYDDPVELDEEFFTGKKFRKPNFSDPFSGSSVNETDKTAYVPRRHVLPPPAPVISGAALSHNPFSVPPPPIVSKANINAPVDFDMVRKGLAILNRYPN